MKIIIVLILLAVSSLSHANPYIGDFAFKNNSGIPMNVSCKLITLPYEGKNHPNLHSNNRFNLIYNGFKHRHFRTPNGYPEDLFAPVLVESSGFVTYPFDYAHCAGQELNGAPSGSGIWVFGKYEIKVFVPSTQESYLFYWNCLDSKYSTPNFHGSDYLAEWGVIYDNIYAVNERIKITTNLATSPPPILTTVTTSQQGRELKMWELLYQRNDPWAEEFYIKTTPFGAHPDIAENNATRVFIIGTKVVLNGVLDNLGPNDNQGYNTYDDPPNEYYSSPIIPIDNDEGNIYVTPGLYSENPIDQRFEGMKFISENGNKITLTQNKKLFISGFAYSPGILIVGDTLVLKDGSELELGQNSEVSSYISGTIIDEGSDRTWASGANHKVYENTSLQFLGTTHTVNNGAFVEVKGNGTLKLGNNTILTFDGTNSHLKLNSNSDVILGTNSKIIFKNGAYIDADNAEFSSSGVWEGIYFEDAGTSTQTSTIKNCTFDDAKVPIKIYNTSTSTANNNIIVQNNTITVPYEGSYGIYADNANKLLIQSNQFSTTSGNLKPCIYIKHPYGGDGLPGGGASPSYSLNIVGNTFSNTSAAMIFAGYTSALVPYYIYGNTGTVQGYGMIGRRITGTIKNNNITSSAVRNFLIHQSNPDFYNNMIKSTHSTNGRGLVLLSESSPKLAPYIPNEQDFVWQAGNNHIEGNEFAIEVNYANSMLLDYGQNTFKIASGSANKHLYGVFTPVFSVLNARNNCWEPSGASNQLWNSQSQVTVVVLPYSSSCGTISPTSSTVTDMGNGIFDTVWTAESDAMPNTIEQDEILYGLAGEYSVNESYLDAIASYKSLIDEHTESDYLLDALYELYACHEVLDTFQVQEDRNIHYGALKTYLEECITSENYGSKFEEDAYNVILMCEGNMQQFDGQVTGYEFLCLYHPDPESRLMASVDLAIVEDLMEGEGGGNYNLSSEKRLQKIKSKVDKLVSRDPVLQRVKKSFDKIRNENKKNTESGLKSKYDKEKVEIKMSKLNELEERIDFRVRENMSIMRTLSKEEKEQRNIETIMILASFDRNGIMNDNAENTHTPFDFSLNQNYPNPFNPSTTISFSIPNDLIVKIKIYDIAGREISTLVNELKIAGNYNVSFNGNGLASGVYFYTINAGSFVETKRMVLVK
jgi:hypothetical protein